MVGGGKLWNSGVAGRSSQVTGRSSQGAGRNSQGERDFQTFSPHSEQNLALLPTTAEHFVQFAMLVFVSRAGKTPDVQNIQEEEEGFV